MFVQEDQENIFIVVRLR